jgi:prefoldin subunit 5
MAENIDDRLKEEVQAYNVLNQERKELEDKLGAINKEMLKILGKIELLNDLSGKDKKKDD